MKTNERRQFVNFLFYKLDPAWRSLKPAMRARGRREFEKAVGRFRNRVRTYAYSLVGIRPDCDLMLWRITDESPEAFQEMSAGLNATVLGRYLLPAYSYLAMTKRSVYVDKLNPEHEDARLQVVPGQGKYLFVYPFVKTRAWYGLPYEERQRMMDEHIRVGNKYPSVKLHTTYSFGLDDQEFVVAFESDAPQDFLDLVMELRSAEASKYTLRDTPTFTCIRRTLAEALEHLG